LIVIVALGSPNVPVTCCAATGATVSIVASRNTAISATTAISLGSRVMLVVDDFIDRIMHHPRLNANPLVDEAHHRVPPAGFKYLATEMVCWAAGGPQKYTGKSMVDSHSHLKITGKEWDAFMDDFQQTLDKFAVPAGEQAELKAIVNSTRSDIVVAPQVSAA
jgi:hemoglobin